MLFPESYNFLRQIVFGIETQMFWGLKYGHNLNKFLAQHSLIFVSNATVLKNVP
jgi:hypothetical protein